MDRYDALMAIYEYFCSTCRERFEERRPMAQASIATTCRAGHQAERTISMFAMTSAVGGTATMEMPSGGGGGCCGGGACGCGN